MTITRRDFLKTAASVVAAGAVIPAAQAAKPAENLGIPEDYVGPFGSPGTPRNIQEAALSVDGVHTATISQDNCRPWEVFVEVNAHFQEVRAAIAKVMMPAYVLVHVTGPVKLRGSTREITP